MMLVISVVTIAAVASASTMVPLFRSGVENLGRDVSSILSSGSVGGVGGGGGTVNGTAAGGATGPDMSDAMNDMVPSAATQGNGDSQIGPPPENV